MGPDVVLSLSRRRNIFFNPSREVSGQEGWVRGPRAHPSLLFLVLVDPTDAHSGGYRHHEQRCYSNALAHAIPIVIQEFGAFWRKNKQVSIAFKKYYFPHLLSSPFSRWRWRHSSLDDVFPLALALVIYMLLNSCSHTFELKNLFFGFFFTHFFHRFLLSAWSPDRNLFSKSAFKGPSNFSISPH